MTDEGSEDAAPLFQADDHSLEEEASIESAALKRDPVEVMRLIANSAVGQYERLPMLDIIFDRMVRQLTESFLHLMSADVSIRFEGVESGRFGDVMMKRKEPMMIAVVNVKEWENACLFVIDQNILFAIVAVMLGGDPRDVANAPSRQPTAIEQKLAMRIMRMVSDRMSEAFSPLTAATFEVERLEMNAQFAAITRATTATIDAEMTVTLDGRSGKLRVVCPYPTLEPVKSLLLQMFMGEKFGRDHVWEEHFERALLAAELDFEAILYRGQAPLNAVADWRVGETIELGVEVDATVTLAHRGQPMFSGAMGQQNGKACIKLLDCLGVLAGDEATERTHEAA